MPTDRLFSPFSTQPFALMVNKSPAWRSLITKKRGSRTSRQEHPFFSALLSSFTRREEGGKRRPEMRRRFAGWSRTGLQRTLPRLTVVTKCAGSTVKNLESSISRRLHVGSNEEDLVTTKPKIRAGKLKVLPLRNWKILRLFSTSHYFSLI